MRKKKREIKKFLFVNNRIFSIYVLSIGINNKLCINNQKWLIRVIRCMCLNKMFFFWLVVGVGLRLKLCRFICKQFMIENGYIELGSDVRKWFLNQVMM